MNLIALCLSLTLISGGPEEPDPSRESEVTSFESAAAGAFESLSTSLGTWRTGEGRTLIDDQHARTGRQCLQLTGGERTSLTLELAEGVDTTGKLSFWAERWTSRAPFSFRIEKQSGGEWTEIYNGDRDVRVGRAFLSEVKVTLGDSKISQLRFTVTSPEGTGLLIDDLRIAPLRPQEIVSADVIPLTLPALVGREASPILKLKIETRGELNPVSVAELVGTLSGTTDVDDVAALHVYLGHGQDDFSKSELVLSKAITPELTEKFVLSFPEDRFPLSEGANYVWLACQLRSTANIDHRVGATCESLSFSTGQTRALAGAVSSQRLGVALRQQGDDGVHTYRIPGLATTPKGTLLGVYDVRRRGGGDLPGDIDVGMSRSTDGGRTWEPMQIIMDRGEDRRWNYDGIGDPAILVDRQTGTIWVAAVWSHGNRAWHGSGPGLEPEETGQLMLVRSDDDGTTWSEPINITRQVKRPEWSLLLQGPGKGITMCDGTLVFAAQYQDPAANQRLPHSTLIFSRDHGQTWQVGTGAFDDTTEAQVVEVAPGVLMLNCRYNRKGMRVVMTTDDLGQTWHAHPSSQRDLTEPGACMASLIDVARELGRDQPSWFLFSNPDDPSVRRRMMIKASPDQGLSWPQAQRLLLDEGRSAGYSCLSMIDEETVGILYEGSQAQMTFQRIKLRDLIGAKQAAESPSESPVPKPSQSSPQHK